MPVDQLAAESFIWRAARLLDRHRYSLLFVGGPAEPVLEALRGYRNADGGFGHALEPDLRCPASQPAPTLNALEVLNEAGASDSELARDARAWIVSIAEEDGGIPFVLAGFEDYPHAPWWSPQPGSFLTSSWPRSCTPAASSTTSGWIAPPIGAGARSTPPRSRAATG